MCVGRTGPSLQRCWRTWEHAPKRRVSQLEAALLPPREAAAGAAGRRVSAGPFLASAGHSVGSAWAPDSHLLNQPCPTLNLPVAIGAPFVASSCAGPPGGVQSFLFCGIYGIRLSHERRCRFPPPAPLSSECSQMDASWMLSDSTVRNRR